MVDERLVELADTGQNFFLPESEVGAPRAKVMCENLLELNPDDVKGTWEHRTVLSRLHEGVAGYQLVLGCDLTNEEARLASVKCRAAKIPFVLIRQYGLIGSLTLDFEQVCVMEQKAYQADQHDLRLNQPFPELLSYADSFDLAALRCEEKANLHSHVPFVVLLLHARKDWLSTHASIPKTFAEKEEFKALLKSKAMSSAEINFAEAA